MKRHDARLLLIVFAAVVCLPATLLAQQIPHGQDRPPGPALSPQEAIRKMTVPDGFTVELVASEPDIVNPVAMTFDERGRVWITESLEYPRSSAGPGRDRVKVLEDTDGDGRADKFTIFADGLNIPSGIAVGYGGVWVANSPDILFLQDTDGDGKADRREVVVTGFGRTDTHELPNSLTWGPDGWLYGLNGVFNRSHVKYRGKEYRFTCALFRIHPRTRDFELFAEGTSNPWGVAWDTEGSAFVSACVIDHLWHLAESGYYHRQGGPYPPFTWKIDSIVDHRHQKAAYCGLHFFDSDAYPPEYRERLYMGNIHGNCINVDVLQRDGSTYHAEGAADFLRANDAWFMPVVQKTGPDGCLYVLDWYDRYHCYQDARRDPEGIDRLKGRLYRIRYKDTPRVWGFDLAKETDDELIERLHSPNVYFRDIAQRLLAERDEPATKPKLEQLVLDGDAPRKARMQALWSLIGAGPLDEPFHRELLYHTDPSLRAWAVRAAGNQREVASVLCGRIAALARDASPDVQLQVAVTANKIDALDTMPLLLEVLAHSGDDELIPHIVWQNLYPLLEGEGTRAFLARLEDANLAEQPNLVAMMPRVVDRLLSPTGPAEAPSFASTAGALFALLARPDDGHPPSAQYCLGALAQRVQTKELAGDRLAAVRSELEPAISRILDGTPDGPLYLDAALLATSWDDPAGVPAVRRALDEADVPEPRRLDALGALVAAKDAGVLAAVSTILDQPGQSSVQFRRQVLSALGRFSDEEVADVVLASYDKLEPDLQPQAIELLTQRVAWSKALLQAIGRDQIPASVLNLNQVRRLLASKDKQLAEQVQAHWGTVRDGRNPQREAVIAEMRRFIRSQPGDPAAGTAVFDRVCGQCHTIYGKGATVGPDITANGRNSFEQLLSNVFDPSLVIGSAYRSYVVVTTDGRVLNGLVVEDTPQRIVLKLQGDKVETIPRSEIDEIDAGLVSMMPEDLEKQLKPQELADLFAFLTLDKPPGDPTARHLPGSRAVAPRQSTDPEQFASILAEVAPGFDTAAVGEGGVALLAEHMGRPVVVRTHPVDRQHDCILRGKFDLPPGKPARLALAVSHHPQGDWQLLVKVNGKTLLDTLVGPKTTTDGWAEYTVDLSPFAGKTAEIELHNHPNNWSYEFAFWGRAEVVSE